MILIIADEDRAGVGERLHHAFQDKGVPSEYISLGHVVVQPCLNCGVCTNKTPGRCAVRDDGDWIYPKVAAADALVLVTPVVFGGFSAKAKRVLDKFGLFMDGHYFVRNGELAKGGLPGGTFRYYAVGTGALIEGEAEVFQNLVRETVVIIRGEGRAFAVGAAPGQEAIDQIASEVASA